MARPDVVRWGVLLSSLGLTVAATLYPSDQAIVDVGPAERVGNVPPPLPVSAITLSNVEERVKWAATGDDPFAPRHWDAPPAAAPETPRRLDSAVMEPAPVPETPLPFKVLGQMSDGGDRVVYLKLGEQVLLARKGEVLEGGYEVVAVTPESIEFESRGTGLRQALRLANQEN